MAHALLDGRMSSRFRLPVRTHTYIPASGDRGERLGAFILVRPVRVPHFTVTSRMSQA